jgi:hypothetical protein
VLPVRVTCTDIKSPAFNITGGFTVLIAKHIGGFGPCTVADIPVLVIVTPQFVLLHIVAVTESFADKVSVRTLNAKPEIVEVDAITREALTNSVEEKPSPKKSLLPVFWFVAK